MRLPNPAYNERSWAIDLVSYLQQLTRQANRPIKDASGEQTIRANGRSLFPDVLLFGDRSTTRILQGWELKMPDTSIYNAEFRENAQKKALALGLDSYLLWNVSYAHLYVRCGETTVYSLENEWSELSDITTRDDVVHNRERWQELAGEIFLDLNDRFDRCVLQGRQFVEAFQSGDITALIMRNVGLVESALRQAANGDADLRAKITLWWDRCKSEYSGSNDVHVLAQVVIANWIGKLLFAHILSGHDSRALAVIRDFGEATPNEALELLHQLSQACNFWSIFSDSVGLSVLPNEPWDDIKEFNHLLTNLRLQSIDQTRLSQIKEATVEVTKRKLRGQYSTPMPLAQLLIGLCLRDIVGDRFLDPCCGSGTIARAAIERKLCADVSPEQVSAKIFAGDLDPQATQTTMFALAKPSLMNFPLRIFRKNVFSIDPQEQIEFQNPTNGELIFEPLGQFEAVACNLPFVSQSGRKHYMDEICQVSDQLREVNLTLTGKADVAAYIPFALHSILRDRGRLAIIITNAWLGTDWGESFRKCLDYFYDLKCVITSGAGKWFHNSDVSTNILILEKKTTALEASSCTKFVVLKKSLEELSDEEERDVVTARIELGESADNIVDLRVVSPEDLRNFRTLGLSGNAQFVESDWILSLPLRPVNQDFSIRRGERRGLNALFYPTGNHGIEEEYIRPLAKSILDFSQLSGEATREAFCCTQSEDTLFQLNHHGALRWIEGFRSQDNIRKLTRANLLWYQMRIDQLAKLVMSINYGDRLFVCRIRPPAFVDQRLVRLDPKPGVDLELSHALLNCSIGMFIIEGLGFGRGLGALDLNKDRIEAYMHYLDPSRLDCRRKRSVIDAFQPLLQREVLSVSDELNRRDRQNFDSAVIDAFGLDVTRDSVYASLKALIEIRASASM